MLHHYVCMHFKSIDLSNKETTSIRLKARHLSHKTALKPSTSFSVLYSNVNRNILKLDQ